MKNFIFCAVTPFICMKIVLEYRRAYNYLSQKHYVIFWCGNFVKGTDSAKLPHHKIRYFMQCKTQSTDNLLPKSINNIVAQFAGSLTKPTAKLN